MNRTDRLVAMVLYLQGRRMARAEDIAAHFEVSLRTVYRDVAALGEAGVPISGEAGVGYSLVKGYHLPPMLFTAEEAAALFVGGEMVKRFADTSLEPAAASALLKIRSVLPAERQEELQRLERATIIGGLTRPDAGLSRDVLRPIQRALVSQRVVAITYHGRARAEDTTREVEPMGMFFTCGAWYLVAWCRLRDEVRHFRLDRIVNLKLETEQFIPRKTEFSLRRHLDEIEASSPKIEVRLRAAADVLERIRAESHGGMISVAPSAGGHDIHLHTYSLEWCARWVLSFGGAVEALAPVELRTRVGDLAQRTVTIHT